MNLATYKTETLAREDVKDIVKFEAVERDRSGNTVIHLTENGRKVIKYDVHLMRVQDGVTFFDKEQIAVIDKGEATEEIEFRAPSTKPAEVVAPSQLEDYVMKHANNRLYLDKRIIEMNTAAPWVRFTGIKNNGNGTGTTVTCFAYMNGTTPTTLELTE